MLGVPRYMNAEVPTDGIMSFHPSPFSFNQETSGYNVLHIVSLKLYCKSLVVDETGWDPVHGGGKAANKL